MSKTKMLVLFGAVMLDYIVTMELVEASNFPCDFGSENNNVPDYGLPADSDLLSRARMQRVPMAEPFRTYNYTSEIENESHGVPTRPKAVASASVPLTPHRLHALHGGACVTGCKFLNSATELVKAEKELKEQVTALKALRKNYKALLEARQALRAQETEKMKPKEQKRLADLMKKNTKDLLALEQTELGLRKRIKELKSKIHAINAGEYDMKSDEVYSNATQMPLVDEVRYFRLAAGMDPEDKPTFSTEYSGESETASTTNYAENETDQLQQKTTTDEKIQCDADTQKKFESIKEKIQEMLADLATELETAWSAIKTEEVQQYNITVGFDYKELLPEYEGIADKWELSEEEKDQMWDSKHKWVRQLMWMCLQRKEARCELIQAVGTLEKSAKTQRNNLAAILKVVGKSGINGDRTRELIAIMQRIKTLLNKDLLIVQSSLNQYANEFNNAVKKADEEATRILKPARTELIRGFVADILSHLESLPDRKSMINYLVTTMVEKKRYADVALLSYRTLSSKKELQELLLESLRKYYSTATLDDSVKEKKLQELEKLRNEIAPKTDSAKKDETPKGA